MSICFIMLLFEGVEYGSYNFERTSSCSSTSACSWDMEPVLILIIGAVLASGTSTAAFTETAVIPSELTKSASYCRGAFTFSATLSSPNPSPALSIRSSLLFPIISGLSGVFWHPIAVMAIIIITEKTTIVFFISCYSSVFCILLY